MLLGVQDHNVVLWFGSPNYIIHLEIVILIIITRIVVCRKLGM